ncbi:hypothetical protein ACFSE1_07345 [Rhizobium helianthi]|uniref:Biotin transporter BioY n=1 Tax=Rhizobium helianthi TaxID=1132695 RepID=A0ABW4M1W2_9HYPH
MSGLETAIRNALERSDRADPNVRERIYHSARQALQAGLQKQQITDLQIINAQETRLEEVILQIESEEAERNARGAPEFSVDPDLDLTPSRAGSAPAGPALGGQTRETASASDGGNRGGDLGGIRPEPMRDAPAEPLRAEPEADRLVASQKRNVPHKRRRGIFARKPKPVKAAAMAGDAPKVPGEKRKPRRRSLIARLFIYLIFFTFLGVGLWWAYSAGVFMSYAERDKSVPNPPASIQEEDFNGAPTTALDPKQGFSSDWLEIYGHDVKARVSPGPQASAETVAMADGPALRITSSTPDTAGDVAIEVPADVLRELAGKTSTLAMTLQAVGDQSVQLAVRCDFSSLGDCSRHRVTATQERSDTLFRLTFDRGLAPTQPGRIFINSDILGGKQPVLVYSIRVLPGQ